MARFMARSYSPCRTASRSSISAGVMVESRYCSQGGHMSRPGSGCWWVPSVIVHSVISRSLFLRPLWPTRTIIPHLVEEGYPQQELFFSLPAPHLPVLASPGLRVDPGLVVLFCE